MTLPAIESRNRKTSALITVDEEHPLLFGTVRSVHANLGHACAEYRIGEGYRSCQPVVRSSRRNENRLAGRRRRSKSGCIVGDAVSHCTAIDNVCPSRLFKSTTGFSIIEYVIAVRIKEAQQLLRDTSKPVTEISAEAGFGDLVHFCRTFKKQTGVTDGRYPAAV